jgi:pimeloyl-ACP methyl ester carboxylesterase
MGRASSSQALFQVLRFFPRIHLSFLAAGLAPLLARIRLPGEALFMNRNNVETGPVERALCYLASDISRGEISQFLDWMKSGDFRTYDRRTSYEQNFPKVRRPLFFIAGSRDHLVPPASVAAAYDRIASDRKAFLVLGRDNGQEEDYGHGDLLMGKNVGLEVFPRILEWLVSIEAG